MFLILTHWLFLWFSLASIGYLFVQLFIKKDKKHSYFFYLWLGYAILTAYLQLASLFLPLNHFFIFILWLFLAIVGLHKAISNKVFKNRSEFIKKYSKLIPFVLIITFFVAFASSREVYHYDSYLYQFKMVAWNKNFPVIPGLANIHERLGFNSSFLLVAAFTELFLEKGMSAFILNGFLVLSLMIHLSYNIVRKDKNPRRKYFSLIILPFLLRIVIGGELASLSTDIPMFIFSLVLILALLEKESLFYILALCVLIPTIKLSGAMTVVILIACLLAIKKKELINNWPYLILSFILGFSFLIRNIYISGYPLFPLDLFAIKAEWRLPTWVPDKTTKDVTAWARYPGPDYLKSLQNSWIFWLPSWWMRINKTLELKFFIFSILLLVFFIIPSKEFVKKIKTNLFQFYLPLLFSILGIIYWFFMAPDLRFGLVYFWILLAVVLIEVFDDIVDQEIIKKVFFTVFSIYFLIIIFINNFFIDFNQLLNKSSYFKIQERQNQILHNQHGFVYYVPTFRDHCGNTDSICVVSAGMELQDHLQYIDPHNPLKGFKVINQDR